MENLIKLHKAQLASDRTSCHSATAKSGTPCAAHRRILADPYGPACHSEIRSPRESGVCDDQGAAVPSQFLDTVKTRGRASWGLIADARKIDRHTLDFRGELSVLRHPVLDRTCADHHIFPADTPVARRQSNAEGRAFYKRAMA